ncbi:hypothetical protein GTY54_42690 [Streptomyces sp. SID625]|nr:hypothetical protein [Streptomyces sp. SID625]
MGWLAAADDHEITLARGRVVARPVSGGRLALAEPHTPLERWKPPLYDLLHDERVPLGVVAPTRPVADLYHVAWRRTLDGDAPRLKEIEVPRPCA